VLTNEITVVKRVSEDSILSEVSLSLDLEEIKLRYDNNGVWMVRKEDVYTKIEISDM